eukprot:TRINITY_DN359_c0_g1_i1.p1 TRINITY_DN359_c0_g1~~TRINITY_DN359_c0_g1_i1.p1  ORF type:complete len:322 (+),score=57.73 TRINITY_DN359_c0_g1_i1:244-1209(+)
MPSESSTHSNSVTHYYNVDLSHFHKLSFPLTENEKNRLMDFGNHIEQSQFVRYCALVKSTQNHIFFANKWPLPTALVVFEPSRNYYSVFTNENTKEILDLLKIENNLAYSGNEEKVDSVDRVDEASSLVEGNPRKPFNFASVNINSVDIFEDRLRNVISTKIIEDGSYYSWQLHPEPERFEQAIELLEVSIGNNIISPLTVEDVELVDSTWAYCDHFSKEYVRYIILNHPTACIRVNGNPVSWGVLHADLSVGIMYTLKEHRGKGLGCSVAAWLSLYCLQKLKISPYCHIACENEASTKMFKKLGYVQSEEVKWVMGMPAF